MPFQSEKQRRFLHANHPEIAKRWEREYATVESQITLEKNLLVVQFQVLAEHKHPVIM